MITSFLAWPGLNPLDEDGDDDIVTPATELLDLIPFGGNELEADRLLLDDGPIGDPIVWSVSMLSILWGHFRLQIEATSARLDTVLNLGEPKVIMTDIHGSFTKYSITKSSDQSIIATNILEHQEVRKIENESNSWEQKTKKNRGRINHFRTVYDTIAAIYTTENEFYVVRTDYKQVENVN